MAGINRGGSQASLSNTLYEQAEIVSSYIMDFWYCAENFIPRIANSKVKGSIETPGQNIVFLQEPEAQVAAYLRDNPIQWVTIKPARTTITCDYAFISAHKLDVVDEFEIHLPLLQKIGIGMGKAHAQKEIEVLLNVAPTFSFLTDNILDWTSQGAVVGTRSSGALYIINQLARMRTIFNRKRVPKPGRYVIVPPEVEEIFIQSDQATFNIAGVPSKAIEEGEWGLKICGFEIIVSEWVPGNGANATPFLCLVGHPDSLGFGRRIQKTQLNIDLQDFMAKGHRSLNYFGFGPLQMKGLGLWKVRTTT